VFLRLRGVEEGQALSYVAAFADPWLGPLAIVKSADTAAASTIGAVEKRAMIGDTLDALLPGPVGRFDRGAGVTVKFAAGALASVDDLLSLAGKTAMAIQGPDGAWEIFSFSRAELVGTGAYRLSRLLRGLGGEAALASRVTPAGATVVLLDDALTPLARDVADIGAPITYAVGPTDRDHGDPLYARVIATATNTSLRPYAPTRLRARRGSGGVTISFIRRARIDGDAWASVEVPLGESAEAYEAEIALPAGRRLLTATAPSLFYPAAQELADFGAPQSALSLSLYQLSATAGRGFAFTGAVAIEQA
jgi:hypothetical protein